jgi:hypothetical protein
MSTTVESGGGVGRITKRGPYNYTATVTGNNSATATSTSVKSGSKNPSWRRQVRLAVNATGAYSFTTTVDGLTWGSLTASFMRRDPFWPGVPRYDNCDEICGGALANNPRILPPSSPNSSTVDIRARINFIQQCRSARRSFQGGVFLGELREAIHMVTRPGQALRQAITRYSSSAKKAVRRGRNLRNAQKALSGTYLEAVFGWRPLFSDIDSGMKALAKTSTLIVEVRSGFARDEWTSQPARYDNVFSGSSIQFRQFWRAKNAVFVKYKGAVGWESANSASSWRQNWGLTLSDFAPTIYELIPYSFLVDYFTNLGQIIDSASFGTVNLRWGCKSAVSSAWAEIQHTATHRNINPEDLNWRLGACSVHLPKLGSYQFTRSPVGAVSVGLGDLRFRCPGVGSTQWLNIAALAAQRRL